MNLSLSDEQVFLREAGARHALSLQDVRGQPARRSMATSDALPDLWPAAKEAGWPGLLICRGARRRRTGRVRRDARARRVRPRARADRPCSATCPRPRSSTTPAAGVVDCFGARKRASSERPTCRRSRRRHRTEVDRRPAPVGSRGRAAPTASADGDGARSAASSRWVPDAPGLDLLVGRRASTASPSAWRSRPTRRRHRGGAKVL